MIDINAGFYGDASRNWRRKAGPADEPRDSRGRWTSTGTAAKEKLRKEAKAKVAKVTDISRRMFNLTRMGTTKQERLQYQDALVRYVIQAAIVAYCKQNSLPYPQRGRGVEVEQQGIPDWATGILGASNQNENKYMDRTIGDVTKLLADPTIGSDPGLLYQGLYDRFFGRGSLPSQDPRTGQVGDAADWLFTKLVGFVGKIGVGPLRLAGGRVDMGGPNPVPITPSPAPQVSLTSPSSLNAYYNLFSGPVDPRLTPPKPPSNAKP